MSEPPIFPMFVLLGELWRDLPRAEFWWQALALTLILAASWALAFRLRAKTHAQPSRGALESFGVGSWNRIAFPLIALALVAILRKALILAHWRHLSLLYVAAALLASWALVKILVHVLRSVFARGGLSGRFERALVFAIWGGLILHLTGLDALFVEMLEQVRFSVGTQELDLWMLLHASVVIGLTLLIALWGASLVEKRLLAAETMDGNLREVFGRLARAFALVVALLLSLSLVGIDVTALSVFSGAFAVGLGFGLQKIASNYVSGFILLLDRSIRLGDLVAIDDKTNGKVVQITTRYTVLRTLTGTDLIIPNEYLVSNIVRNLSYADTQIRVALSIPVAYGSDLEAAMALMAEAAARHPRVLADPAPGVILADFGENAIVLELGFWIADPHAGTGNVRSEVALALWQGFREKGIVIPYPQREIRIVDALPAASQS